MKWSFAEPAQGFLAMLASNNNNKKKRFLAESRAKGRSDMGPRRAECCGEPACCSRCCQEGTGWPYQLLTDILPAFLPGFAKGADTAGSSTARAAEGFLSLLPWDFVHSESSLGCSGLEIAVLTRVNFILGMHRCNSPSSMEGFYSAEVLPFWAWVSLFLRSVLSSSVLPFGRTTHDHYLCGCKHWTTTCKVWAGFVHQATNFTYNLGKLLQLIQASLPHLCVTFRFSGDCYSSST